MFSSRIAAEHSIGRGRPPINPAPAGCAGGPGPHINGIKGAKMSDTSQVGAPPPQLPRTEITDTTSLRSLVVLSYVLFLLACVNGVTAIVGVIIAYVKRRDAMGTIWESHFNNLILVFWVMVGATLLFFLSWPFAFGWWFANGFDWLWAPTAVFPLLFGFIFFPVLAIWYLYRVIRGLIRAGEDRAY
jgi:uncharacterized membrane protein